MDNYNYLLAVGGWTEDKALNQSATPRPKREQNKGNYSCLSAEPQRRASSTSKADYAGSGRQNYCSRLSRAEDELLEMPPRHAIKEVRAAQMIQRQHPACFVKAEGGQQGNEATAKPSGSFSRMERHFLKQASAYLPLEGHEVKFRTVYWSG